MKITKRQLKRIIKEEKQKLLREYKGNPAEDGMRAARHEGTVDYGWLAEEVDRAAVMIEQLWNDAESALIMNDHKSLSDDLEKLVNDAFGLALALDSLSEMRK